MKKDVVTKMIIVGVVGILVLTIMLFGFFSMGRRAGKKNGPKNQGDNPEALADLTDIVGKPESYQRSIAVIRGVSGRIIEVFDIDLQEKLELSVKESVEIKSEYGEDLAINQLHLGDMVDIKYVKDTKEVASIQKSGRIWERTDTQTMTINRDKKIISILNDLYNYNDNLVVSKANNFLPIDEVSTADDLVIRGYRDTVWSIVVKSEHGTIVLKNEDAYIGGDIEIGNRDFRQVTKGMSIKASPGFVNIIISKEEMPLFSKKVFVEENKEVVIDLKDFQPKVSQVDFKLRQKDAKLYINDKLQEDLSATLDYGSYSIRVEKEGYNSYTDNLVVNQAYMEVPIDMEKESQYIEVQTPKGADLYIDARKVGTIPSKSKISPGEHIITIRKEGFYSKMQTITVEDNGENISFAFPDLIKIPDENDIKEKLEPITPPAPKPNNSLLNPTEDSY